MRLVTLPRVAAPVVAALLVTFAVAVAVAPNATAATPVGGKYASYAYVGASRQGSAIYINGLVKQDYSAGLIRSPRRTVYLQRDFNGGWQTILSSVTDWYGAVTLGFISVSNYRYRYVVYPSGSAWGTTSAVIAPPTFKYATYAYIGASRQGPAVSVNGVVAQDYSTGLIRSPRRTVYLQRMFNGGWQTILSSLTDWYGMFTLGLTTVPDYQYRYVVYPSGSAWGTTSGVVATTTPVLVSAGSRIITEAKKYVGLHNPGYVYGGTSPVTGFDCSGYTQYLYRVTKVANLPRTAQQQHDAVRIIPASQARAGDLIFYLSGGSVYHDGIYAGNGMQYAAATPQDGIRYQPVWSTDVQYGTTWH